MATPKFERQYLEDDYRLHQEYVRRTGDLHYHSTVFTVGDSLQYGFQCARCHQYKALDNCPNCGGSRYVVGKNVHGVGIFGDQCDAGRTRVRCDSCGTENSVARTFGWIKTSACFIATAAYGYRKTVECHASNCPGRADKIRLAVGER